MYSKWGTIFALLAFACIFIATARDSWSESATIIGTPSSPKKTFGGVYYYQQTWGGYSYDKLCSQPKTGSDVEDFQRVSAAMIAFILLSNITGFWASFNTILASTRSTILSDFKPANGMALASFVSCVVTWAIWLRNHQNLKKNGDKDCHFYVDVDGKEEDYGTRTLGGSFALYIVASFFYIVLFFWTKKMMTAGSDPSDNRKVTLFIASVAYTCVFVGSCYNIWTESETDKFSKAIEKGNEGLKVFTGSQYGVYNAMINQEYRWEINHPDSRRQFCTLEGDIEADGSGAGLANSSRVTLGFAITSVFFGIIAFIFEIIGKYKAAFWTSLVSFMSVIVLLLVWAIVAHPIILDKCCTSPDCQLGTSYGLAAIAAFFLGCSLIHKSWVIRDDVYILKDPKDYGMRTEI